MGQDNPLSIERPRCGTCAFATRIPTRNKASLCCWRFPPTIHRVWFRLTELYPSVEEWAICGEHQPASPDAALARKQGQSPC